MASQEYGVRPEYEKSAEMKNARDRDRSSIRAVLSEIQMEIRECREVFSVLADQMNPTLGPDNNDVAKDFGPTPDHVQSEMMANTQDLLVQLQRFRASIALVSSRVEL